MPLSDGIDHQGVWFLPEQPERRVTGRLSFDAGEGSVLELVGSLQSDLPSPDDFAPAVVLGIGAVKAVPITLLDCVQTSVQWNSSRSGAMITSSLRPTFVLVGAHLESREAVQFDDAYLRFSNLEQWAAMPGFEITFDLDGNSRIEYRKPEDVPLIETDSLTMTLMAWPTLPIRQMVQTDGRISHRVSIRVQRREPAGIEEFLEITRQLQQFLTLLVGEPVIPTSVDVRSEAFSESVDDRVSRTPIDALFRVAHGLRAEQRQILPVEMLLSRPAMGEDLMSVTRSWFESQPLLEPVYDLFAASVLNPEMYLDQSFLAMMQAVESFHRRTREAEVDPAHLARLERILSIQNGNDRDWLEEQLQYSHEPSLRKRLRELLQEVPEIAPYIGNQTNFVQDVVATRHYLTHYDPDLRSTALRHEGMWNAIHKLRGLLTAAILRHLGISGGRISELLQGTSRLARYLRLAAERSE